MNATTASLLLAALTLALTGCTRRPCDSADVQQVVERCRVTVVGAPQYTVCHRAGLTPPPGFDFLTADTQACTEQGQGQLMSCVASRSQECLTASGATDYSRVEAVFTECSRSPPSLPAFAPPTCAHCEASLQTCLSACPTNDWDSCATCAAPCDLAYGRCLNQCS